MYYLCVRLQINMSVLLIGISRGVGGMVLEKIPFVGKVWIFSGTSHQHSYHIIIESVLIL